MQSLAALILTQLVLAAPAAGPSRPAHAGTPAAARGAETPATKSDDSDYRETLAEYEKLDPAERQRYVERLIADRLEAAAFLTLDDTGLARQREIDAEILNRLRKGQTISTRGLVKLLRKIDLLERTAVQRLAHDYRVEVYSLFHSQEREYERRIAAWNQALAAWTSGGAVPAEQRLLVDWLRAATDRLRADRLAQLPPQPTFTARPGATSVVTAQPPVRLSQKLPREPGMERPRLEPAPVAGSQRLGASQLPDLEHRAPHDPHPRVSSAAPAVKSAAPVARPPSAALAENEPPRLAPAQPLGKPPRQVHMALKPPSRPLEPVVEQPPAAGAIEPRSGRVDLDELAVRITGHNLALARVAGRLQDKELWTADQLAAILTDLEDLTARRGDLLLYWELIAERERTSVGALQSPAPTISLLGAKIIAARVATIGHHGDSDDGNSNDANSNDIVEQGPVHAARTDQFDRLSRRLAQLVSHERGR